MAGEEWRWLATSPGVRRIPTPIVLPTITASPKPSPSSRRSWPVGEGMPAAVPAMCSRYYRYRALHPIPVRGFKSARHRGLLLPSNRKELPRSPRPLLGIERHPLTGFSNAVSLLAAWGRGAWRVGRSARCHARGRGNSERNEPPRAIARGSHHHWAWFFLAGASSAALTACGSGTLGIISSANSDSGGNTVIETSLAGLRVESPKSPPARLRFNLTTEATVEFFFQVGAGAQQSMLQIGPNPRLIAAGDQSLDWNFEGELGLDDGRFHPTVKVFALIDGVQEQPVDGVNSQTLGLGNDAPA